MNRPTYIIGQSIIRPENFKTAEPIAPKPYVPARDNPTMTRRPGSMDAFKLPSMFLGNRTMPTHHTLS